MNELVKLAKGLISPTDVAVSGKLTPQAAERIISMVFKDDFLSKVQSVRMTKLKRQVSAIDAQNQATGAYTSRGKSLKMSKSLGYRSTAAGSKPWIASSTQSSRWIFCAITPTTPNW